MTATVIAFIIIFTIAIAFFIYSCYRRFGLVLKGKPENRFNNPFQRTWFMLKYAFGQRRVVSKPFGFNHFFLFWAFMILLISNTEFLLNGLAPSLSFSNLPDPAYFTLAAIFDIISGVALLCVIIAVIRRIIAPPPYTEGRSRDAFTILSMIAVLMIAYFGLHASNIAAGTERATKYMFIGNFGASLIPAGATGLGTAASTFWWIHAIVLLSFLNYLPYSKHIHILSSIENCFLRSPGKVNTQPREEFKKGSTFGVGKFEEFTWKDLFDSYACTECGRCSDNCPASRTDKTLQPRILIHNIKMNMLKNANKDGHPEVPLIGGVDAEKCEESVSDIALWECTTCGACMEVCPVFIEHVPHIIKMRRNLVEMKARFPEELLTFFENMEQRSNPWGIAPSERTKWAQDIEVKPFEAGKTEYLFYVGCAGALDPRNRQTTLSVAKILNKSGITWGTLGRDEMCCGESMRRLGNEFIFDRMAQGNINLFKAKGVKKIIVTCPHCFNVFKNDYKQYGADFEVIHHTQFINDLIKEGKLKLKSAEGLGNIVFHDSCYLGRYNEIYEAPRQVLKSATGKAPTEMDRHRDKGFCCGAGGGRMWMEEKEGKLINVERTEQALEKKPDTVCVCCPYCMTMFDDGLKDKEAAEKVQVLDLAEIVAKALSD
jgi:Fe-S oxidoreductase/nitrate reductase gamma subunit